MSESTAQEVSTPKPFSWSDWVISNFLSVLFLVALCFTVYYGWSWNFGLSRKLAALGFLSFFSMMLILIRNPEIPKSSGSFVWVLLLLFLFSVFFLSFPEMRAFFKENKSEIIQFFRKRDIEIPGIIKVTENVEKIQKLADESQRTFDGMKDRIEELNKISSFSFSVLKAQADDRTGLEELHRFIKSEDPIFSPLARMERENLLRTEEHFNSLSSDKQISSYFPNVSLASITEPEISSQFIKKCQYRDEIWEFFDAMRKDSSIPELEKNKFYFRIIKDQSIGRSVLAYRWATALIDSNSGWPFIQPGKKTEDWDRFSTFKEWYEERQKK